MHCFIVSLYVRHEYRRSIFDPTHCCCPLVLKKPCQGYNVEYEECVYSMILECSVPLVRLCDLDMCVCKRVNRFRNINNTASHDSMKLSSTSHYPHWYSERLVKSNFFPTACEMNMLKVTSDCPPRKKNSCFVWAQHVWNRKVSPKAQNKPMLFTFQ